MKRRVQQKQSSFANATKTALGVGVISLVGVVAAAQVSALTYQNSVDVSFTIEDTITISLSSSNLMIDDLAPGAAADSNIITVNVQSNNPRGYTLNSTVGDSTHNTRNLNYSSSGTASPFSSIDYGTTVSTLNNLSPNQWGYSFSLDNGTTWINANKTGDVNDTGYSGLPLYTDEEHITTLKESSSTTPAGGDNIKFKIAAKASAAQISGEYKNIINFTAIGTPAPAYMQDFTAAQCQAKASSAPLAVIDRRDGESYLVQYLAGKCWMLDDLRLDLTNSTVLNSLTTSNTHVDSASLTSLKSGNRSAGAQYASSGFAIWNSSNPSNAYNQAKANADYKTTTTDPSYGLGSGQIGLYYNYCAASAGSYCYDNYVETGNAQYDLCPAGWRMPTGGSSGEYQALYNQYSGASEGQEAAFRNALSTPLPGYFNGGSAYYQNSSGFFWSSTLGSYAMYSLHVSPSSVSPANSTARYNGTPMRCVAQ